MIPEIISWSIRNRFIVIVTVFVLSCFGWQSLKQTPVDAIPDLSENQVIVYTEWMGRSPQLIEDQITYPLVTNLQGLPNVKAVRANSMQGMSFIYIIFEDDVDIYWARSRVMERLSIASTLLPDNIKPTIGPDGTGVGHIYWYVLEAPNYDLAELRTLQDWYVKFALQSVEGVSEVASFGGFEKEYQISVDPYKLNYYKISFMDVLTSVKTNNNEVGGRSFEIGGSNYMIRGLGYIGSVEDIENINLKTVNGIPIKVKDIASVQPTPKARLGIIEENGEGEKVGGIVVMRYGENADNVIKRVKEKMTFIQQGLPEGVTLKPVYDRSSLIEAAIDSLKHTITEEIVLVCIVIMIFLLHFSSSLVVILNIPVSILLSFITINYFDITSNIMSLSGIAIAIGVIVDDGIVMVENAYRHLSERNQDEKLTEKERISIIEKAARQVGKPVVYSTIVIIVSFLPVFMLTEQEGKLFHPLATTKTLVMIGSAILAITFVPVLMTFFLKGKFRSENDNIVTKILNSIYEPILHFCLKWKKTVLGVNILALIISIPMFMSLGKEFMPPLDEESILFMPVTLPDVSNSEIKRILQLQDKIIKTVPEVENVLGKAGRANSATDNAPISMIESIILLKPKSEWRPGIKKADIIAELNAKLQIPGVMNGWTQPIINRINMLATGIRSDVGIKVYGADLNTLDSLSKVIRNAIVDVKGVNDLFVEQITGGKYLDISVDRDAMSKFGVSVDAVNEIVEGAIGGMNITNIVEGRERYAISIRLSQDYRNSISNIEQIPIQTPSGIIPLKTVAKVNFTSGPSMISSENAMLKSTVLFNVRDRDLEHTVKDAMEIVSKINLPSGYFISWSGQWENQIRATQTLNIIIPIVLLIIFVILYMTYNEAKEAIITMLSVPFALIGGVFMVYFYQMNISVAVAVGFIALFGVAVETGMLMVVYLDEAMRKMVKNHTASVSKETLRYYIIEGSAKRLRPKLMTVSVTLFGLIPVLWSNGTGIDLMLPIAIPVIGGMITSTIHVLLVTPIIFEYVKEYELKKHGKIQMLGNEEYDEK